MGLINYILVTPCKNEEKSLPKLAESIINQTIRPKLWVIVDDGSTDKSPQILGKLTETSHWIKIKRLETKQRDLGIHVAHVYREGFRYAIQESYHLNLEFSYIGVIDADLIPDYNYFELLINEFEKNELLGICSGRIGNNIHGKIVWESFSKDLPTGGARLWRKRCFEETGGYLLTCSPDSVSNVKAKLKGWITRTFENIRAISTRPYASAEGQWIGYRKLGMNNYFIGYTPIHIFLKGFTLLYSRNGYFKTGAGLAYVYGYFTQYINKRPRINDGEVILYYKSNRIKELLCSKLRFLIKIK